MVSAGLSLFKIKGLHFHIIKQFTVKRNLLNTTRVIRKNIIFNFRETGQHNGIIRIIHTDKIHCVLNFYYTPVQHFYLFTCWESLSFLLAQQQGRQPAGRSLLVGDGGKLVECRLFFEIPTPLKGRSMSINSRSCKMATSFSFIQGIIQPHLV